jgi:multisubunit Na+/H+ antiporter MnhE subunit
VIQLAVFCALWFLFVSQFSVHESLVGIIAVGVTVWLARVASAESRPRFHPKLSWLLESWRLPGMIFSGLAVIARRLWQVMTRPRPPKGIFLAVPFEKGGHDARSATRRALAVFYTTLPPNFIIIDLDYHTGLLLFHQVQKDPVPEVTKRLGAK